MKPSIEVAHLFASLDVKLIALLNGLTQTEWQLKTLAKKWAVKDVAAHLLDGNIRAISVREGYQLPAAPPINSYIELVQYLDTLNASWVKAMQRVSPRVLIELLEKTGHEYCAIMQSEPLFEPAPFSVAWAGETTSLNWFHIAREYTEKMHHQLQIRQAVGNEAELLTREFFHPFISTLMYGLPHALRHMAPAEGTCVEVTITGESGGSWFAERCHGKWLLKDDLAVFRNASISMPPAIAWKLFTKGITPSAATAELEMSGDLQLCMAAANMVAVMA